MLADISNLAAAATPRRKDAPKPPATYEVACAAKPEVEGTYELDGEHNQHPQWAHTNGEFFLYRCQGDFWWIGTRDQRNSEVEGHVGSEFECTEGELPEDVDLWQASGAETWYKTKVEVLKPDQVMATPSPVSLSQEERGMKRDLVDALLPSVAFNPSKIPKLAALVGVASCEFAEGRADQLTREAKALIVDPVFHIASKSSRSKAQLETELGRPLEAGEFHEDVGSAAEATKTAKKLVTEILGMLKSTEALEPRLARKLLEAADTPLQAAAELRLDVLAEWWRVLGERRGELVRARVASGGFAALCEDFVELEVHAELENLDVREVTQLLDTACQLGEQNLLACIKSCVLDLRKRDPSLAGLELPALPAPLLEELAADAELVARQGDEKQQVLAARLLLQLVQLASGAQDKEPLWRRVLEVAPAASQELREPRQAALSGLLDSLLGREERTSDESEELATLLLQSGRLEEVAALVPNLRDPFLLAARELVSLAPTQPAAVASRLLAAEAERQYQAGSFDAAVASLAEAEKLAPGRQARLRELAAAAGPQGVLLAMEVLHGDTQATSDTALLLRVLRAQPVAQDPGAAQALRASQQLVEGLTRTVTELHTKYVEMGRRQLDMGRELEALRAAPTSRLQQGLQKCAFWSHELNVALADPGSKEQFVLPLLGGLQTLTVSVFPHGDGQKNNNYLSVVLRGPKGCRVTACLTVRQQQTQEVLKQDRRLLHWHEKSQKLGWPQALETDMLLVRGTIQLSLEFSAMEEPAAPGSPGVVKQERSSPGRDEGPIMLDD